MPEPTEESPALPIDTGAVSAESRSRMTAIRSKIGTVEDLTERIIALEGRVPGILRVMEQLTRHDQSIQQLSTGLLQLTQQRAMIELQMERNARATALDLAIKATPGEDGKPPSLNVITMFAGGFLEWLKGGTH